MLRFRTTALTTVGAAAVEHASGLLMRNWAIFGKHAQEL
jgi:hypothetical protein